MSSGLFGVAPELSKLRFVLKACQQVEWMREFLDGAVAVEPHGPDTGDFALGQGFRVLPRLLRGLCLAGDAGFGLLVCS